MKLSLPVNLGLALLAAWTVSGAENVPEYNARVWQSDEGLPVDAAWTAAQTADGYLWVGTRAGLARFDGSQFAIFDSKNVPGLTDPNVTGLFAGGDGALWVATGAKGMYRLKNGTFTQYTVADGLANNQCIGGIFEDGDGSVWVGTAQGLCRWQDGKFTTVYKGIVRGICQDHEHKIWLATTKGIDCWDKGTVALHVTAAAGIYEPDVRAICCGSDGTIWVGVGAAVCRVDQGKVKPYIGREGPNYNLITALYQDRHGTFWVGTYSGLNRIVNGRFVPELNADGLPYSAVMCIFEDRENNLWACAKDGLIRLKPNRVLCYTQRQGLANDNVCSVLENQAGAICIGTWGGGLNRLSNGVITAYTNATSFPTLVLGQCQSRAGSFWVGADFNEGLFELNDRAVRHFAKPDGSNLDAVRVVFEDQATNLWIGTSSGLFQMRQGKLHAVGGLERQVIRALGEDHEGNLWIGTQTGLVRDHEGTLTRFGPTNGLAHYYILEVFEDRENTLWLGTLGGGLARYHDGAFTYYTTREGLFSDVICSVMEDDRGWLWMGSDRGIFRVNRKNLDDFDRGNVATLRSIRYGKTDGMVNKICNGVAKPSVWKSRDGRLWFATIKGVCVIDPPKNILPEAPPPPVVIEELRTEQQAFTDPEESAAPIRLRPGRGELEFRYAALGFRAPEENRYQYKLEGLDTGWVNAESRQIAHYNNVYPGHYRFHVMACNSDGVWNETGATLAFIMPPHFWQTWWFGPAWVSLTLCALVVLYRIVQLRRREVEQLRVRIAADLHDDIGSNLASIALLSQLGETGPEKAGHSELSEIHRIALQTVNGIREIVWFTNPEYDTMPEMVARMRSVTAQMLPGVNYTFMGPVELNGGKLSLEFRRNLFLIFKEILHNVVKHARAGRVDISLRETEGKLMLRVADDGLGFNPTAVSRGHGLRNIRLRAAQLHGTVDVTRGEAGGAVVTVQVRVT